MILPFTMKWGHARSLMNCSPLCTPCFRLTINVLSNSWKSVCTWNFFCPTFCQDSSVFGMTCMKYVQKHFCKEHLCALVSRLVCARTCAELRGNVAYNECFLLNQAMCEACFANSFLATAEQCLTGPVLSWLKVGMNDKVPFILL